MALFGYERRIDKINEVLAGYGISSIEAQQITKDAGLDVYNPDQGIQPICFENACWALHRGAAIAIKDVRQRQKLQQQSEKDFRLSCSWISC